MGKIDIDKISVDDLAPTIYDDTLTYLTNLMSGSLGVTHDMILPASGTLSGSSNHFYDSTSPETTYHSNVQQCCTLNVQQLWDRPNSVIDEFRPEHYKLLGRYCDGGINVYKNGQERIWHVVLDRLYSRHFEYRKDIKVITINVVNVLNSFRSLDESSLRQSPDVIIVTSPESGNLAWFQWDGKRYGTHVWYFDPVKPESVVTQNVLVKLRY